MNLNEWEDLLLDLSPTTGMAGAFSGLAGRTWVWWTWAGGSRGSLVGMTCCREKEEQSRLDFRASGMTILRKKACKLLHYIKNCCCFLFQKHIFVQMLSIAIDVYSKHSDLSQLVKQNKTKHRNLLMTLTLVLFQSPSRPWWCDSDPETISCQNVVKRPAERCFCQTCHH